MACSRSASTLKVAAALARHVLERGLPPGGRGRVLPAQRAELLGRPDGGASTGCARCRWSIRASTGSVSAARPRDRRGAGLRRPMARPRSPTSADRRRRSPRMASRGTARRCTRPSATPSRHCRSIDVAMHGAGGLRRRARTSMPCRRSSDEWLKRFCGAQLALRSGGSVEAGGRPRARKAAPLRVGAIRSREDAMRALDAVAEFFRRTRAVEPGAAVRRAGKAAGVEGLPRGAGRHRAGGACLRRGRRAG